MPHALLFGLRFLFAWFVLSLVPALLWGIGERRGWIDAAMGTPGSTGALGWVEASAAVAGVAFAIVAAAARWLPPAQPWLPPFAGAVLRAYLPFLLGWVAVLVGYLALMRAVGQPVAAQPQLLYLAQGGLNRPAFWLVVLVVVVAAPLAEEIAFRGYLQPALAQRFGATGAAAATAVVFGLMHGIEYALPVGLLGGLFGWLVAARGCLLPAVFAHMLHNGVTVAVTVLWPGSLDLLYPMAPR